ncbi:MAG: glutamate-5-semialdehyde dehydrogenase [Nannocystaceae bacterium]
MNVAMLAAAARAAGRQVEALPAPDRTALLEDLADALTDDRARAPLLAANRLDMKAGQAAVDRGELAMPLYERLELTPPKLESLADGLRQLARNPDSVGRRTVHRELDQGLVLDRIACPLGLLGAVFEARPDAVPQIVGLALKSGNAILLKGGREANRSNRATVTLIHGIMERRDVDPAAVCLLEDRAEFRELLDLGRDIDMIIARGSSEFVRWVEATTSAPVLGHAEGLCHLYLHGDADPDKAAAIAVDGKCTYPAACNAIETLLWEPRAGHALDKAVRALTEAGVQLRGCEHSRQRHKTMIAAHDDDWSTEYSGPTLATRMVDDLDAALAHIERFGSRHTETIVTEDPHAAERFLARVDAACVFHNASSRFSDGYRFGLGAEVGISTGKLHARGPVGVEGLLTYKWQLRGEGQITTDYGAGKRSFLHRDILDTK